mmetsp:Transcript_30875/g.92535  ORF Transcript_30875/g.92535 Transcript_30875/m.92535 type:complete len:208 (-) Transcript_30875:36-659(-)
MGRASKNALTRDGGLSVIANTSSGRTSLILGVSPSERPDPAPTTIPFGSPACAPESTLLLKSSLYALATPESYFSLASASLATPRKSKYLRNRPFPPAFMDEIWASVQESIRMERTNVTCTPSPRCRPEHSRHITTPYETEAHSGRDEPQSTHASLPGRERTDDRAAGGISCDDEEGMMSCRLCCFERLGVSESATLICVRTAGTAM